MLRGLLTPLEHSTGSAEPRGMLENGCLERSSGLEQTYCAAYSQGSLNGHRTTECGHGFDERFFPTLIRKKNGNHLCLHGIGNKILSRFISRLVNSPKPCHGWFSPKRLTCLTFHRASHISGRGLCHVEQAGRASGCTLGASAGQAESRGGRQTTKSLGVQSRGAAGTARGAR